MFSNSVLISDINRNESTVRLVEKLCTKLAKIYLDNTLPEFSKLKKEFIRNSKKKIWNSILNDKFIRRCFKNVIVNVFYESI
jgi:hypothetical protein